MKTQPRNRLFALRNTLQRLDRDPANARSKANLVRLLQQQVEEIELADCNPRHDSLARQHRQDTGLRLRSFVIRSCPAADAPNKERR